MIANKLQAYDYNERETEYDFSKKFKILKGKNKPAKNEELKINKKTKVNNKLSLILTTLSIFTMLFVVSYRYNIISEKNLKLQRLNIEQENVNAALIESEVKVSQNIDMNYIESYAKQQLGMQKPEKSQIVYINTNYESKVETIKKTDIITKVAEKIETFINNILK